MKKMTAIVLLVSMALLFTSCGGRGRVSSGVYHHHHGYGPWWGSRDYYRDRVIVVPDEKEPIEEATPLPSEPEDMPDMGMPDMDFGDMGGDW